VFKNDIRDILIKAKDLSKLLFLVTKLNVIRISIKFGHQAKIKIIVIMPALKIFTSLHPRLKQFKQHSRLLAIDHRKSYFSN
jgi:hypothetical protein